MRLMRRPAACLLAIVFLVSITHPTNAQSQQELLANVQQYATASARIVNTIVLPALRDSLSASDEFIISQIDFRFPPILNAFDVRAFIDTEGTSVIEISGGHVMVMDQVIDTNLVAWHFNRSAAATKYMDKVIDVVRRNYDRVLAGEPLLSYESFETFAGIDSLESSSFRQSAEYRSARDALMINVLAMEVGHEFAHHVLRHTLSRPISLQQSREREAAADAYATKLALASGFSPLGAMPAMFFFTSIEEDTLFTSSGDHPSANCRQVGFILDGMLPLMDEPEFDQYLEVYPEQAKQLDIFLAGVPMFERVRRECCSGQSSSTCEAELLHDEIDVEMYCGMLNLIRVAASSDFADLREEEYETSGKDRRWEGAAKLQGVTGCSVYQKPNGNARYACRFPRVETEGEWQALYVRQKELIQTCGDQLGIGWDLEVEEEDQGGEFYSSFSTEDESGDVFLSKGRGDDDFYVRMTIYGPDHEE